MYNWIIISDNYPPLFPLGGGNRLYIYWTFFIFYFDVKMFWSKEVWLLVVLENTCLMNYVLAQHGVSFLISYYGKKYLFDCGQIFMWLDYNFNQMKIDAKNLEAVIISHDHHDHCYSLPEFISSYNPSKIYVPSDFKSVENENIVKVDNYFEIEKWLFLTGSLDGGWIKEQSLIMDFWVDWIVIVTWCSHPWLINIILSAQEITWNKKIMWIIWGFHLANLDKFKIQNIIDYLKKIDLWFIVPGHCTGSDAVSAMKKELWSKVKTSLMGSIGVGNNIKFFPKLEINLDEWEGIF